MKLNRSDSPLPGLNLPTREDVQRARRQRIQQQLEGRGDDEAPVRRSAVSDAVELQRFMDDRRTGLIMPTVVLRQRATQIADFDRRAAAAKRLPPGPARKRRLSLLLAELDTLQPRD